MNIIPEHLTELDKKLSKYHDELSFNREFYKIEDKYIFPYFHKQNKVISVATLIASNSSDLRSLKRNINAFYKNTCKQFDLDIPLKNCVKKNALRSYYHPLKQTVFINKRHYEIILKNQGNDKVSKVKKLMYTIIHELAHAIVDVKFKDNGIHIHDYFFLFVLTDLLAKYSGVKQNNFLTYNVPIIDSYGLVNKVIGYSNLNDYFHKESKQVNNSLSKDLYLQGDYDDILSAINACQEHLPSEKVFDDYEDKDGLINDFNYHKMARKYIEHKDDLIFEKFKIHFISFKNKVQVYIEKESKIKKRIHKIKVKRLQKIFDNIKEKEHT